METTANAVNQLNDLVQTCEESARRFYHAAEHIRNRGLKLILKSYVQQRVRFANELRALAARANEEIDPGEPVTEALNRGWMDIKATMTVQRQGRQELVLSEIAGEEAETLSHYAAALKNGVPPALRQTIERHYNEIRTVQRRLALLAEDTDNRVLIRLFNHAPKAEQAVQQLTAAGFAPADIYITPIEQLDIYRSDAPQKRRSMRDTVATTVVLGITFGAILGLLLALAQRIYFPELGGIFSSTPTGLLIELIGGGALIGALFSFIFGLFIGRDAVEDDAYLEEESLSDGDTLVAVFTDDTNRPEAERIIGLRHQFEVEPVAAAALLLVLVHFL